MLTTATATAPPPQTLCIHDASLTSSWLMSYPCRNLLGSGYGHAAKGPCFISQKKVSYPNLKTCVFEREGVIIFVSSLFEPLVYYW